MIGKVLIASFFGAVLGYYNNCGAQSTLTLEKAIDVAQQHSINSYIARNMSESSYWRYQNFKASFRPQIRLNATIPTFFRSINPVTQPDGSIAFRRINQANNLIGLNLQQNIGLTGGLVRLGSSLQRTDNFSGDRSNYFLSTPFTISYIQSSLLYNELSWKKRIEPLLYEISEKTHSEMMAKVALEAVQYFLSAIEAQMNELILENNLTQSDTIYHLSRRRFELGTIAKSDLLQLELNVLKAQNKVKEARILKESTIRGFKRLLGLNIKDSIILTLPSAPPLASVKFELALEEARSNRSAILEFRSQRLVAEQEVAKSKGQNSLEFGINADIGTQQTASNILGAYGNLQNQQYLGVSLNVPLKDWGYRKSQIRLAKANREVVEVTAQQDEILFEQEIYLQVLQFNQHNDRLIVAKRAKAVAEERLNVTRERYLVGKINVVDLNLAFAENVSANQSLIQNLREYWISYYTLRHLTLYDFLNNRKLIYENNTRSVR